MFSIFGMGRRLPPVHPLRFIIQCAYCGYEFFEVKGVYTLDDLMKLLVSKGYFRCPRCGRVLQHVPYDVIYDFKRKRKHVVKVV